MYYRPQGYRYPRDMRIPSNYSGSAFRETEEIPAENTERLTEANDAELDSVASTDVPEIEESKETVKENKEEATPASILSNFRLSSLFGGKLGGEELLILAVILLLSDTDGNDDVVWLLLLLLFIK